MEKIVIIKKSVVEACPEGTVEVIQRAGEMVASSCEVATPLIQAVLNSL